MVYKRVLARMTSSVSCETNRRTCGTCTIGLQAVLKCDHILNLFSSFFLRYCICPLYFLCCHTCLFCFLFLSALPFSFFVTIFPPPPPPPVTTFALFSFYVRLPCLLFFCFVFALPCLLLFFSLLFCHYVCPFFFYQSQRP